MDGVRLALEALMGASYFSHSGRGFAAASLCGDGVPSGSQIPACVGGSRYESP